MAFAGLSFVAIGLEREEMQELSLNLAFLTLDMMWLDDDVDP